MKGKFLSLLASMVTVLGAIVLPAQAQTPPADHSITVRFFLPSEMDQEMTEQIEKAEHLIRELLNAYQKHVREKKSKNGTTNKTISFSAARWSQKLSQKARKEIIKKLLAQWGSQIEIIYRNRVWALKKGHLRRIPKKDFAKAQKEEEELAPLIKGNYNRVYDGNKAAN